MTNEEKYLFDVAGYLVVDDAISRDYCQQLVDTLHEIISTTPQEELPTGVGHRETTTGEISVGDLPSIGPLFADLIDLPPVIDILSTIIGPRLRLEIAYALIRRIGFGVLACEGSA